jgi:putative ABC transport system ATP-binding protein
MALLELDHVGKRYRRGERVALDDISLVIDAGEMVTVWGERRSGRSTLLRIVAGIEAPDTGAVRFAGQDLTVRGGEMLGAGISYCRTTFRSSAGQSILDQLAAASLARGIARPAARLRAWTALERTAAEQCAMRASEELNGEETVRVAIARALVSEPRLLVIDEPTIGVALLAQDGILELLRSLADDGAAVLTSTADGTGLLGADRVLSLRKGRLQGEATPKLAPVTDISRGRRATG